MNWETINDDINLFSLENKEFTGKVVSIYDGDTVKIVFKLFNTYYKWNCRINNVDTPEIRSKCELEKKNAIYVRDRLKDKILNQVVKVNCGKFDKYGRLLVTIYFNEKNINEWLINKKYAFKYDGGTKKSWINHKLIETNDNKEDPSEPYVYKKQNCLYKYCC